MGGDSEDGNSSRLGLFLSNYVEDNPGTVIGCKWANCTATFSTVGECGAHIAAHVGDEKCCKWERCSFKMKCLLGVELHAVEHAYDNKELFPSLDDWLSTLLNGQFSNTVTLHYVPKHIRSKLQILLFDEDFELPASRWTIDTHVKYLEFQLAHFSMEFKKRSTEFLEKRKSFGEEWSDYVGKDVLYRETPSTSSSVSDPPTQGFCSVQSNSKFIIVQVTAAEIASKYNLETQTKQKRKPETTENTENTTENTENIENTENTENTEAVNLSSIPWFKTLISNLSRCRRAIKTQRHVLNKMREIGMIDSANQKFLWVEQVAAKAASMENCTAGTFVCFVFKYRTTRGVIFYIRYLESGRFSGFFHRMFVDILREKYSFTDDNCLIHNVYTREDLDDMKEVTDNKTCKRKRPDKIIHTTIANCPVVVDQLKNMTTSSDTSPVKLESLVINLWPYKPNTCANSEKSLYLEFSEIFGPDLKQKFVDFKLDSVNVPLVTSRDFLEKEISDDKLSLYEQSVHLNCLSSDIKRDKSKHLFKRFGRFEANFLQSSGMASSLRNQILILYLEKKFRTLYLFLERYFSGLGNTVIEVEHNEHDGLPGAKRQKKTNDPANPYPAE